MSGSNPIRVPAVMHCGVPVIVAILAAWLNANQDKDARADARAAAFQKAVANERNRIHEVPSDQSWINRLIDACKRIVGRG